MFGPGTELSGKEMRSSVNERRIKVISSAVLAVVVLCLEEVVWHTSNMMLADDKRNQGKKEEINWMLSRTKPEKYLQAL